jgi:phosphoserine phosphatase RsbU/P
MQPIAVYLDPQELANSLFQSSTFHTQATEVGFALRTNPMPTSLQAFKDAVAIQPEAYIVVSWQALNTVVQPASKVNIATTRAEKTLPATINSSVPPASVVHPSDSFNQMGVHHVLHAFQKEEFNPQQPFVLLYPGSVSSKAMLDMLHAGFDDVIQNAKPSLSILNRLLQLHKAHQRLVLQEERLQHIQQQHSELDQRNLSMEKELEKTRILQMSLLPPDISGNSVAMGNPFSCVKLHHRTETCTIHGLYLPCDAIGGDLYDLITFQDGTLGLLMSDVSGHGVPAAFVTAMLKSAFYKITHNHHRPDNVLFHLNNQLAGVVKTGDYSTAIYCHLNEATHTLEFAGAGHPYPLHYSAATQRITRLEENGTPLVWVPDMPYLQQTVQVATGDKILIFTDGISELMNGDEEMLGEDRLQQLFLDVVHSDTHGQECLEYLLGHLSDFAQGYPLQDDMTMMLVEIH